MSPRRPLLAVIFSTLALSGIAYIAIQRALDPKAKVGVQPGGEVLVTTHQVLTPFGLVRRLEGARPKDLAISPDGTKVAALCTGRVALFSEKGEPLGEVRMTTGAVGIAWSPQGECFAAGQGGSVVRIAETDGVWAIYDRYAVDTDPKGSGDPQVNGLALAGRRDLVVALLGREVARRLMEPLLDESGATPLRIVLAATQEAGKGLALDYISNGPVSDLKVPFLAEVAEERGLSSIGLRELIEEATSAA